MEMNKAIITQAINWRDHDPDATDREELTVLIEAASGGNAEAVAELEDRFSTPLTFGTAGLRGAIGAGMNRMSTAVVTTAAAGIARVAQKHLGHAPKVVIGYDGRHRSLDFAVTSAGVFVEAGAEVALMPRPLPTPVLAFALKHLGYDVGIMVTASHNPPQDNGYKVYLGGELVTDAGQGAQIVSPWDKEIQAAITAVGNADSVALAGQGWSVVGEEVIASYVERAAAGATSNNKDVRIVLTSMHGVGAEVCTKSLRAAGFQDIHEVAAQKDPDPDFPTVSFPNPEEPGALDLAMELARKVDADIIIANDPDADRSSAAVIIDGEWTQLSGDQVGWLLGSLAARDHRGDGAAVLARSVVSSSMLDTIATEAGCQAVQTLTGFKWIARTPGIVFGYEEAIGYCTDPEAVTDKDGISASVRLAQLAADVKAAGRTIADLLDDLALAHGLYMTAPLTFRVEDTSLIAAGMKRLRTEGGPELLGTKPVVETADLADGWRGLPPTDGMYFGTEDGARIIARPSGTEPKLKCYLEIIEPVSDRSEIPAARQRGAQRLTEMKEQMRQALGFTN